MIHRSLALDHIIADLKTLHVTSRAKVVRIAPPKKENLLQRDRIEESSSSNSNHSRSSISSISSSGSFKADKEDAERFSASSYITLGDLDLGTFTAPRSCTLQPMPVETSDEQHEDAKISRRHHRRAQKEKRRKGHGRRHHPISRKHLLQPSRGQENEVRLAHLTQCLERQQVLRDMSRRLHATESTLWSSSSISTPVTAPTPSAPLLARHGDDRDAK